MVQPSPMIPEKELAKLRARQMELGWQMIAIRWARGPRTRMRAWEKKELERLKRESIKLCTQINATT